MFTLTCNPTLRVSNRLAFIVILCVVEVSVTKAIGAVPSGCASITARDRLAVHFSKDWLSAGVQLMVC